MDPQLRRANTSETTTQTIKVKNAEQQNTAKRASQDTGCQVTAQPQTWKTTKTWLRIVPVPNQQLKFHNVWHQIENHQASNKAGKKTPHTHKKKEKITYND